MAAVLAQREGEAASVERAFDENLQLSGVRKVWRQLLREGHTIARCTMARLMRTMGLAGVIRGRRVKTTARDRVDRNRRPASSAHRPVLAKIAARALWSCRWGPLHEAAPINTSATRWAPVAMRDSRPFPLIGMLRIYCLQ